jgi:putative ABC transport system permease protein
MMVVSMAGLGLVGGILGLPLGIAAYHVVVPMTEHSAHLTFPHRMLDVWHPGRWRCWRWSGSRSPHWAR